MALALWRCAGSAASGCRGAGRGRGAPCVLGRPVWCCARRALAGTGPARAPRPGRRDAALGASTASLPRTAAAARRGSRGGLVGRRGGGGLPRRQARRPRLLRRARPRRLLRGRPRRLAAGLLLGRRLLCGCLARSGRDGAWRGVRLPRRTGRRRLPPARRRCRGSSRAPCGGGAGLRRHRRRAPAPRRMRAPRSSALTLMRSAPSPSP